jgi:uncharacterized protein (TIGR02757 family)
MNNNNLAPQLQQIKTLLDGKYAQYNNFDFIETDPIQIPHLFAKKEDIEISAFITATIAWGQRKSIIKNAKNFVSLTDNDPYEFIMHASDKEIKMFQHFVHRTFQGIDCMFFIDSLRNIYTNHSGLENVFTTGFLKDKTIFSAIQYFREIFFSIPHPERTRKHISDVSSNSSAKRINMFLRWMIRTDGHAVDFGLWKNIPSSALMLPLDVHTGNIARQLTILHRKQNDWIAVNEVTSILRIFDPADPVKYDFALFGMGAFE